jgi:coenzyme F420 hydrogenase subunit beta
MTADVRAVVTGGFCVGCGACAAARKDIKMEMTADGRYEPAFPPDQDLSAVSEICPFSASLDEDDLSASLFGEGMQDLAVLGRHLTCFAGHVAKDGFRDHGSSGGLGSWIAARLLEEDLIDAVIHVRPMPASSNLNFAYAISNTVEDVRRGAKSRYYPVEVSEVVRKVLADDRRFLFMGLPCFVKAIRLMQEQIPILKKRIPFTVGLVCGHLKTAQFADYYSYAVGSRPSDMASIDFRHKIEGNKVGDYGVKISGRDGTQKIRANRNIFGVGWGHGFFKINACDYCDDILGETADLTIGDAWLSAFEQDWRGTNIVVVRNATLLDILRRATSKGDLNTEEISPEDVLKSQEAGIRHRRTGLSYRLWLKDCGRQWRPRKRVQAQSCAERGVRFRLTQRLRMILAEQSRRQFVKVRGNVGFGVFKLKMAFLIFLHDAGNRGLARAFLSLAPAPVKRSLRKAVGIRNS